MDGCVNRTKTRVEGAANKGFAGIRLRPNPNRERLLDRFHDMTLLVLGRRIDDIALINRASEIPEVVQKPKEGRRVYATFPCQGSFRHFLEQHQHHIVLMLEAQGAFQEDSLFDMDNSGGG